jgi:hypothetical protein
MRKTRSDRAAFAVAPLEALTALLRLKLIPVSCNRAAIYWL